MRKESNGKQMIILRALTEMDAIMAEAQQVGGNESQ